MRRAKQGLRRKNEDLKVISYKNKCLSVINEGFSANKGSIWAIKNFGRNLSQKNAFLWPNKAL